MKILYITNCTLERSSGISKKIMSQCRAMLNFSEKVDLVSLAYHDVRFVNFLNESTIDSEIDTNIYLLISTLAKILRKIKKLLFPINDEKITEVYDVIYIRRLTPLVPSYISFIKKIKKNAKVYYEIPTYPYIQEHMKISINNFSILLFEYRSIERLKKVVDEFVVVVEIEDKKARERLGKYKIIPNGFDVDSVKIRTAPVLDKEVHILGLANLAYWHGFDRIITGMARYTGPYKIVFHLAGGTGNEEIEKLRNLASDLGVIDNVIFYEPLYGEKLNEIFDECHVAAGALGIHRKELHLTSELKLREYCARGIPFFMSSYDPQFENLEHKFKVSEDDSPIDIAAICEFTKKVYLEKNHPELMHNFAKENIDWKILLKRLFD